MNKVLWLDDMRDPFSKDFNTWYPTGCEVYWVKTFEEFTSWITTLAYLIIYALIMIYMMSMLKIL